MPEIAYIFGDICTGDVIDEIRLNSVSLMETLDGGEFRATFYLDQTGKTNSDLIGATTPGKTYCVVERDGVIIGDYLIWTRTYQSQAKVAQLYGCSFKDYTECRILNTDFSMTADQRNIMRELFIKMMSDDGCIQFDLPDVYWTNEIVKTVEVEGNDYKTYRQVIDSFADTADGFDWLIRTKREGNKYVRRLDIGYPQIGALTGPGIPVFEYISPSDDQTIGGGNIINYWANDSMASGGTHFYGIGNGEGDSMLVSEVVFNDLIVSGFPRYDVTMNRKDVTSSSLLTSLTFQYAVNHRAPTSTITAEVKADAEPQFGGFGLGDTCRIIIKDPRYPDGMVKDTRILGWEYYPPDDQNVEMVRLKLEGEDVI